MRKKFITLLLFLVSTMFITSCYSEPKEVTYRPIALNFDILENQYETSCYHGEETLIFSIGENNGRQTGPFVNTTSLILYDHINEKVIKEFSVNTEAYVYSALPYQDGILYVDYDGTFENVKWKLTFINEEEKKIIKEGWCNNWDQTPVLSTIDNTPVFFWEDRVDGTVTLGLSKLVDGEIINIFEQAKQGSGNSYFTTNGHEYFFIEGEEYGIFAVGDMSGLKQKYPLDKKLVSYTMTQKYIVCSLAENNDGEEKYYLLRIDINNGKEKRKEVSQHLYRLEGFGKNTCIGVYYDFRPFYIDLKTLEISEGSYPPDREGSTCGKTYFRASENSGIAICSPYDQRIDSYYFMTLS